MRLTTHWLCIARLLRFIKTADCRIPMPANLRSITGNLHSALYLCATPGGKAIKKLVVCLVLPSFQNHTLFYACFCGMSMPWKYEGVVRRSVKHTSGRFTKAKRPLVQGEAYA
jgi:hypothetical protein